MLESAYLIQLIIARLDDTSFLCRYIHAGRLLAFTVLISVLCVAFNKSHEQDNVSNDGVLRSLSSRSYYIHTKL